MKIKLLLTVFIAQLITGCSSVKIDDYANTTPNLDLFEYFNGNTKAWGIFQDRNGALKRQFVVDIKGEISGNTLTLTEDFQYADGEQSQRIWKITKTAPNQFTGRANDVIGEASGTSSGAALNWKYDLELPYGKSTIAVSFNDWMFLQPNNVLINRALVSKFGFRVGEVTLTFQKGNHL